MPAAMFFPNHPLTPKHCPNPALSAIDPLGLNRTHSLQGVVERVLDKYVGEIAMQGSGDVVRVDQAELETVIPKPGGRVAVLNGPHRLAGLCGTGCGGLCR